MACMNKRLGEQIGETVGSVIQVDTSHDSLDGGRFLRVLVDIDIHKPVARGKTIKWQGESLWIPFRYKKLPKICFSYGCMVHGVEGCQSGFGHGVQPSSSQFGSWLRATNFSGQQGVVPGNERKGGESLSSGSRGEGSVRLDRGIHLPTNSSESETFKGRRDDGE